MSSSGRFRPAGRARSSSDHRGGRRGLIAIDLLLGYLRRHDYSIFVGIAWRSRRRSRSSWSPASGTRRSEIESRQAMPRRAYRASEAARRLGISLDTLRRWDRQGRIKTSRDAANRRVVAAGEVERLLGRPVPHELSARNRLTGVVRNVRDRRAPRAGRDGRGPVPDRLGDHERGGRGARARAGRHRDCGRQGDLDHGGAMRALAALFALVALVLPARPVPAGTSRSTPRRH